jgi:hypothetical protein
VTHLSSKVCHLGRHDSDPRARLRYLMVTMVALVVVVLLVVGFSTLHALT